GNELSLLGGGWARKAPFSCADACLPVLGEQTTVELLVMDACCNWATGWSNVNVEDKSNPALLKPLADLEISCEAYNVFYQDVVESAAALGENGSVRDTSGIFDALDSLWGSYRTVITNLDFDYYNISCAEISTTDKIADTAHDGRIDWIEVTTKTTVLDTAIQSGTHGIIEFVCEGEVVQDVWLDLDECGNGIIIRRFRITSGCSSQAAPLTLQQVIEVRSACSLRKSMMDIPADFGSMNSPVCLQAPLSDAYFPDALGRATVKPHLAGVLCNSISIGRDIKELDVQGQPGLKKYEIVWRMLDWCADVAVDLTHTQVVIARIDGECNFDGGETSGSPVEGALNTGNLVRRGNFVLHQNHPNPFEHYTVIGFELPEATQGRLVIYEVTGKVLKEFKGNFVKGYNEVTITQGELPAMGMLYYQLETEKFVATKKMVRVSE
ncbi:MAG TPA: T9SS type A sorting domain-containing protein, partial [Membranihabitans sp.]|nr:T9SS type A sorting domain-containing protein [Membranihabitans sp.]